VAGDERRCLRKGLAAVAFNHAQHCERYRHESGLGVLGQGQLFGRAIEHELGEALLEGLVDLVQHIPGGAEGGGQVLAHADELAALPGEDEGANDH
jgi:hypothetical protein